MPINDDELHAFIEETPAEVFAGALVKVHEILKKSFNEEDAAVLARDYWNFILNNAQMVLELDLEEAEDVEDDVEFRG